MMRMVDRDAPADPTLRKAYDIVRIEAGTEGCGTEPVQDRMVEEMDIGYVDAARLCSTLRSSEYCDGFAGWIKVDEGEDQ